MAASGTARARLGRRRSTHAPEVSTTQRMGTWTTSSRWLTLPPLSGRASCGLPSRPPRSPSGFRGESSAELAHHLGYEFHVLLPCAPVHERGSERHLPSVGGRAEEHATVGDGCLADPTVAARRAPGRPSILRAGTGSTRYRAAPSPTAPGRAPRRPRPPGAAPAPCHAPRSRGDPGGRTHGASPAQTIYDPTCGSGSLLLKAADEAPLGVSIYGQEMDNSTWSPARMNMILHGHETAEIWKGNTLAAPHFKAPDETLKTFDYIVANPPSPPRRGLRVSIRRTPSSIASIAASRRRRTATTPSSFTRSTH